MSGQGARPVGRDGLAVDANRLFLMSRARVMLRLDIPCTHCNAEVGNPCRTPAGRYLGTSHSERVIRIQCS